MGGADIVPGVSGGTVALVLGIYDRLILSVSRVDGLLFKMLKTQQWRKALAYLDLYFLMTLGSGILVGILSLAKLMKYLLETHSSYTMSAFFGLILASSWLVAKRVQPNSRPQKTRCGVAALLGVGLAYWLVSQSSLQFGSGLGYTFVCGAIAICAMILPGISGSYILLILGLYRPVLEMIHHLKEQTITGPELTTLAVLGLGCVTGLLLFSKLLRWVLVSWHAVTLATLGGFMIGSLYNIWPFKMSQDKTGKLTTPFMPTSFGAMEIKCLGIGLTALLMILLFEKVASSMGPSKPAPLNRPE